MTPNLCYSLISSSFKVKLVSNSSRASAPDSETSDTVQNSQAGDTVYNWDALSTFNGSNKLIISTLTMPLENSHISGSRRRSSDNEYSSRSSKPLGLRFAGALIGGVIGHKMGDGSLTSTVAGAALGAVSAPKMKKKYRRDTRR